MAGLSLSLTTFCCFDAVGSSDGGRESRAFRSREVLSIAGEKKIKRALYRWVIRKTRGLLTKDQLDIRNTYR
jgi:hypothetical protein